MKMTRKGLCAFLKGEDFCLVLRDKCKYEHEFAPCRLAVRKANLYGETHFFKPLTFDKTTAKGRFASNTSRVRGADVYRSCTRKSRYKTNQEAQKAARKMSFMYGTEMRSYYCRFCEGYHLTKKPLKIVEEN